MRRKGVLSMNVCDVESIEDFSRYYRGVFIPLNGEVHRVQMVEDKRVILSNATDRTVPVPWDVLRKERCFGVPEFGIRNYGPTLAYFSISPVRQSNRGYVPSLMVIHQFNSWESRRIPKPMADSWDVAKEVFFPRFFSFQEAKDSLNNGNRIGAAITPRVGLYTTARASCPLIAHKHVTVGYVGTEVVLFNKNRLIHRLVAKDLGIRRYAEREDSGNLVQRSV